MEDALMDWQNLLVTAAIQAGIGVLFWLLIQRQVEKFDRLKDQLDELSEKRIAAIEVNARDESERNAARRREIYERLVKMERDAVTLEKCHEQHQELMGGLQEYRGAVIDLAKVQEKTAATAAFVNEVNQRVISLAEDVARMEGKFNGRH
jgi:hypothetical protein